LLINEDDLVHRYNLHGDELDQFIRLTRQSASMDYTDVSQLREFFDHLKVPYINASGEADDLITDLLKRVSQMRS